MNGVGERKRITEISELAERLQGWLAEGKADFYPLLNSLFYATSDTGSLWVHLLR